MYEKMIWEINFRVFPFEQRFSIYPNELSADFQHSHFYHIIINFLNKFYI